MNRFNLYFLSSRWKNTIISHVSILNIAPIYDSTNYFFSDFSSSTLTLLDPFDNFTHSSIIYFKTFLILSN